MPSSIALTIGAAFSGSKRPWVNGWMMAVTCTGQRSGFWSLPLLMRFSECEQAHRLDLLLPSVWHRPASAAPVLRPPQLPAYRDVNLAHSGRPPVLRLRSHIRGMGWGAPDTTRTHASGIPVRRPAAQSIRASEFRLSGWRSPRIVGRSLRLLIAATVGIAALVSA